MDMIRGLSCAVRHTLTCGSHFTEVISPTQNDSGLPGPALHGPSGQSRQAKVDGQVN